MNFSQIARNINKIMLNKKLIMKKHSCGWQNDEQSKSEYESKTKIYFRPLRAIIINVRTTTTDLVNKSYSRSPSI